jgi:hypothetical protein
MLIHVGSISQLDVENPMVYYIKKNYIMPANILLQ